jgi:hypothetical protein
MTSAERAVSLLQLVAQAREQALSEIDDLLEARIAHMAKTRGQPEWVDWSAEDELRALHRAIRRWDAS